MLVTCMIVHARVDQFLPQLSMEQFNTLRSKYRDIEHVHEGVCFCLFDLILYVPVNNFSAMSGCVFLG